MGGVLGALLHRRSGGRPPAQGTRNRHLGLTRQPSTYDATAAAAGGHRKAMLSKKYSYIPDTYTSLDQVRCTTIDHLPSCCSISMPPCARLGTLAKSQLSNR